MKIIRNKSDYSVPFLSLCVCVCDGILWRPLRARPQILHVWRGLFLGHTTSTETTVLNDTNRICGFRWKLIPIAILSPGRGSDGCFVSSVSHSSVALDWSWLMQFCRGMAVASGPWYISSFHFSSGWCGPVLSSCELGDWCSLPKIDFVVKLCFRMIPSNSWKFLNFLWFHGFFILFIYFYNWFEKLLDMRSLT